MREPDGVLFDLAPLATASIAGIVPALSEWRFEAGREPPDLAALMAALKAAAMPVVLVDFAALETSTDLASFHLSRFIDGCCVGCSLPENRVDFAIGFLSWLCVDGRLVPRTRVLAIPAGNPAKPRFEANSIATCALICCCCLAKASSSAALDTTTMSLSLARAFLAAPPTPAWPAGLPRVLASRAAAACSAPWPATLCRFRGRADRPARASCVEPPELRTCFGLEGEEGTEGPPDCDATSEPSSPRVRILVRGPSESESCLPVDPGIPDDS